MTCGEIYKKAKSHYEDDKDIEKAKDYFKKIIDDFPKTHEARYAQLYIDKIESQGTEESSEITGEHFQTFRRLRLIWPFLLFGFMILAFLGAPNIMLIIYFIVFAVVSAWVYFWPCPRCGKFYCTKIGFISNAWPYVSNCLHCGLKIKK